MVATALGMGSCKNQKSASQESGDTDTVAVTTVQFNADSAYAEIVAQCDFGPRVPNTEAHAACCRYIVERFKSLGLSVIEQKADLKTFEGKTWHSTNIIASYKPELKDRIIICSHWDSRPWADEIGKIHMFIGMNADEMSVCMDFLHDLGIFFTLRTQKKKSCLHIPLFQAFQKCLRMIRIWSIIKCQSHFLNFLLFDFS